MSEILKTGVSTIEMSLIIKGGKSIKRTLPPFTKSFIELMSGEQAISLFEEWCPRFIWMDMRMPVMDSYEATTKIHALPCGNEVKITASTFEKQHKTILETGCDDVVHKLFKSHEVFNAMKQQLGIRYTYKEAVAEPPSAPVKVSADVVAALPEELKDKLRLAAQALSNEDFKTALIPVRKRDPVLADGLAVLAREFRLDRILELLSDKRESDV